MIAPLQWWNGERVEYDIVNDDEHDLLVRNIKHIVRAEDRGEASRAPSRKARRSKAKAKKAQEDSDVEEADLEPWELDPGRIDGFIRDWNPNDPAGQHSDETKQLIAYSREAMVTRQVKNASFFFSKTLTLPFFGSGVVDLPPGSSKTSKNTRRMHMVFFMHSGRVSVTVNDNQFRIGKGGQWIVARGEFSRPVLLR